MKKMSLFFLVFVFCQALFAQENCSVSLDLKNNHYEADGIQFIEGNLRATSFKKKLRRELRKKGYRLTEAQNSEYVVFINFMNALTKTDCYAVGAYVRMVNRRGEKVAVGSSEASILRQIFFKKSIPAKVSSQALKDLVRNLPLCSDQ